MQRLRHTQRQPSAVELGLAMVDGSAPVYLGFCLRIGQWAPTDTEALAAHGDHLSSSSTRLLTARGDAVRRQFTCQASGRNAFGEDNALTYLSLQRRQRLLCQGVARSPADRRGPEQLRLAD